MMAIGRDGLGARRKARAGRGLRVRAGALIASILLSGALATGACTLPEDGATPLHTAAGNNTNPSVIKALIEGGANPGARDDEGATPLHMAAANNVNPSVIKALIEAGANPGARDYDGFTPFNYAKENEALKGTEAYWLLYEALFE